MDSWQPEQVQRMKAGGNEPFILFIENYTPADEGGYKSGMSIPEKYQCWAATQYREKLEATIQGKEWSQSAPPPPVPKEVDQTSGLRKSRASNRAVSGNRASPSPAPSGGDSFYSDDPDNRKAGNEDFFARLGEANATRSADLPPSQGGRYTGFGNTPTPPPTSTQHPSFGLSSASAPSLSEFQENPVAALGKGWSIFSAAVVGASKAVQENVIQPGIGKVTDPTFIAGVKGYATEAGRRAGDLSKSANEWSRAQLGVDVAEQVGGLVTSVKGMAGGPRPGYSQYDALHHHNEETSALYSDAGDDDFFAEHGVSQANKSEEQPTSVPPAATTAKAGDGWDEWKEF